MALLRRCLIEARLRCLEANAALRPSDGSLGACLSSTVHARANPKQDLVSESNALSRDPGSELEPAACMRSTSVFSKV